MEHPLGTRCFSCFPGAEARNEVNWCLAAGLGSQPVCPRSLCSWLMVWPRCAVERLLCTEVRQVRPGGQALWLEQPLWSREHGGAGGPCSISAAREQDCVPRRVREGENGSPSAGYQGRRQRSSCQLMWMGHDPGSAPRSAADDPCQVTASLSSSVEWGWEKQTPGFLPALSLGSPWGVGLAVRCVSSQGAGRERLARLAGTV